jgi:hypothetical protein
MNFYFDYIYYRLTKLYFKWDGRTGATGIVAVSMIQGVMLLNCFILVYGSLYGTLKRPMQLWEKPFILIAFLSLVYFNYKKYNGTYNKLRFHWREESSLKRLYKGCLVIISILAPWIISFIIALHFQNNQ